VKVKNHLDVPANTTLHISIIKPVPKTVLYSWQVPVSFAANEEKELEILLPQDARNILEEGKLYNIELYLEPSSNPLEVVTANNSHIISLHLYVPPKKAPVDELPVLLLPVILVAILITLYFKQR
jgi:hypothetical protein